MNQPYTLRTNRHGRWVIWIGDVAMRGTCFRLLSEAKRGVAYMVEAWPAPVVIDRARYTPARSKLALVNVRKPEGRTAVEPTKLKGTRVAYIDALPPCLTATSNPP